MTAGESKVVGAFLRLGTGQRKRIVADRNITVVAIYWRLPPSTSVSDTSTFLCVDVGIDSVRRSRLLFRPAIP